jgi:hypothetical protein
VATYIRVGFGFVWRNAPIRASAVGAGAINLGRSGDLGVVAV